MINYYHILGIPEEASAEDIKTAYRKLAVKYHPDKDSSKTGEKFREVTEAYEILKNSESRQLFDQKLKPAAKKPARGRRGSDVNVILKVNLNDIVGESSRTIVTTRSTHCTSCDGSGSQSLKALVRCPKCGGTGIDVVSAVVGPKKFCAYCKGYGDAQDSIDCKKCSGTGLVKEKIQRTIKLSREKNERIILKESGSFPIGAGTPGDLIISIQCESKHLYEISGKNIKGLLPISPAQAVLGDVIFLDVFDNAVKVTVPPGTFHDAVLEQHNVPLGAKKGVLILKVQIAIPKNPSDEEKNLYKQLLKIQKGFL